MRAIGIGAVIFLLAGCGGGAANDATAESRAPANMAPAAPVSLATNDATPANATAAATAPAPDLEGARVLLGQIYMPYTRGETSGTGPPLTPELQAAIARQSDDLTGLGADPFCDCQDFGNFRYTIRSVEPVADGAVARVAISNFGESRVMTIRLAHRGNAWLVADIGDGARSLLRGGPGGR